MLLVRTLVGTTSILYLYSYSQLYQIWFVIHISRRFNCVIKANNYLQFSIKWSRSSNPSDKKRKFEILTTERQNDVFEKKLNSQTKFLKIYRKIFHLYNTSIWKLETMQSTPKIVLGTSVWFYKRFQIYIELRWMKLCAWSF